jgi:hypothetical protein
VLRIEGRITSRRHSGNRALRAEDFVNQVSRGWSGTADLNGVVMPGKPSVKKSDLSLLCVPAFWPMAMGAAIMEEGEALYAKNLKFVEEEIKINDELRPKLATPNQVRLNLRTMALRDYGQPGGIPTLIDAPYAGHTAMIADYHKDQSLVQTLLANGISHVALTDWKSATQDMKDLEIDNYLADVVVAIDDLVGRVNMIGICPGGWAAAMISARFPEKVNALVLAGAPIDMNAGNGPCNSICSYNLEHSNLRRSRR